MPTAARTGAGSGWVLAITSTILVAEVVGAVVSGSPALLAGGDGAGAALPLAAERGHDHDHDHDHDHRHQGADADSGLQQQVHQRAVAPHRVSW